MDLDFSRDGSRRLLSDITRLEAIERIKSGILAGADMSGLRDGISLNIDFTARPGAMAALERLRGRGSHGSDTAALHAAITSETALCDISTGYRDYLKSSGRIDAMAAVSRPGVVPVRLSCDAFAGFEAVRVFVELDLLKSGIWDRLDDAQVADLFILASLDYYK